ncbi:hypothetical protein BUALT_Bualt04G0088700 [Buddleja alternifolia]|uniref:Stress response protein NST1-like n=1 Tax=Buddleja alternifolia TaxID=168488 RepID=A0AAV6XUW0_9LAMI|nr:hypothetical protein BUALT_Bualt04G0088700 [Buddleja alternifolia]
MDPSFVRSWHYSPTPFLLNSPKFLRTLHLRNPLTLLLTKRFPIESNMKRKKWSELEEQTLLSKYSDLLNSRTLAKLKTREKKFKPVADHVNSVHHLQDPITFPFKWSWRDVSIKVQNMRHQYLGVKQKIRTSNNEFNWGDGEIHWENFLKYKEVFGDIELSDGINSKKFGDDSVYGIFGYHEIDSDDVEGEEEVGEEEEEEEEEGEGEGGSDGGAKEGNQLLDFDGEKKSKKGFKGKRLRMVGAKVLELREMIVRREEKKREREWGKEEEVNDNEASRKEREMRIEKRLKEREENVYDKEIELEEMQMRWAKREFERRVRLERELDEERRHRMKLEEKWEEEEMEWRERIVEMQIEHEKQMMQMHADACQNQLQILGVVARLVCQFFGSANDGLGGGLGTLPPQVLQNLQHPGGLGDSGKNDSTLPSEFL